jgi:hypothetical protein
MGDSDVHLATSAFNGRLRSTRFGVTVAGAMLRGSTNALVAASAGMSTCSK